MPRSVTVLVLGDLARSPRMMYHIQSLLTEGFVVRVVAYEETAIPKSLGFHDQFEFYPLAAPGLSSRHSLAKPLFILYSLLRISRQYLSLLWLLCWKIPASDFLLVQNPPALPSLMIAHWASRLKRMHWIIDWHNFSYTILAMKLGSDHIVVRLMARLEKYYAKKADQHLCVSNAMEKYLQDKFGLDQLTCLHDHAPQSKAFNESSDPLEKLGLIPDGFENAKRLVSSSSWTKDENFDLLLDALQEYDQSSPAQKLLVTLTGIGAGKEAFEEKLSKLELKQVHVITAWFELEDYLALLTTSDLGVSFHTSSSGLDLPMKIADMQGAGLPVCAYNYGETILEQINENNGRLFKTGKDLARHLLDLFTQKDGKAPTIERLKHWCENNKPTDWHTHWKHTLSDLINRKQRIGFVHPVLGLGGAERWLIDTASSLQTAGYEIEVLTGHIESERCFSSADQERLNIQSFGSLLLFNKLSNFVFVRNLYLTSWIAIRIFFSRRKFDHLIIDTVPHTLPMFRKSQTKNRIYYGHFPDHLLAPKRSGLYAYYRKLVFKLEEYGLHSFDEVIVNSQFTQGKFLESFPDLNTRVVYPGIEIEKFSSIPPISDQIVSLNKIQFLVVSRIHPDKNLQLAIEAFSDLCCSNSDLHDRLELVIAGGYDQENTIQVETLRELKQLVTEHSLDAQVQFSLNCSDQALLDLYAKSFAILYTPKFEHFGLVPIEAMAAARPVIASNKGGPTETIITNETGFLAEADTNSFKQKMQVFIDQPDLAKKMGDNGRQYVSENFNKQTQSLRLIHGHDE